jgi:hypothetical protein
VLARGGDLTREDRREIVASHAVFCHMWCEWRWRAGAGEGFVGSLGGNRFGFSCLRKGAGGAELEGDAGGRTGEASEDEAAGRCPVVAARDARRHPVSMKEVEGMAQGTDGLGWREFAVDLSGST